VAYSREEMRINETEKKKNGGSKRKRIAELGTLHRVQALHEGMANYFRSGHDW
jgi:hypothetical protein